MMSTYFAISIDCQSKRNRNKGSMMRNINNTATCRHTRVQIGDFGHDFSVQLCEKQADLRGHTISVSYWSHYHRFVSAFDHQHAATKTKHKQPKVNNHKPNNNNKQRALRTNHQRPYGTGHRPRRQRRRDRSASPSPTTSTARRRHRCSRQRRYRRCLLSAMSNIDSSLKSKRTTKRTTNTTQHNNKQFVKIN